jgi:hypothetical protein
VLHNKEARMPLITVLFVTNGRESGFHEMDKKETEQAP